MIEMPQPNDPFATVQSAIAAGCIVHALCQRCDRVTRLDLETLSGTGYGKSALGQLPLKCIDCGSRDGRVIVSGSSFRQ